MEVLLKYVLPIVGGVITLLALRDRIMSWFKPRYFTCHKDNWRLQAAIEQLERHGYTHLYCTEIDYQRRKVEGWKLLTVIIRLKRFLFYIPGRGWVVKRKERDST
jgi:hypothetical protein